MLYPSPRKFAPCAADTRGNDPTQLFLMKFERRLEMQFARRTDWCRVTLWCSPAIGWALLLRSTAKSAHRSAFSDSHRGLPADVELELDRWLWEVERDGAAAVPGEEAAQNGCRRIAWGLSARAKCPALASWQCIWDAFVLVTAWWHGVDLVREATRPLRRY